MLLRTYGGETVLLVGICIMTTNSNKRKIDTYFDIVDVKKIKPLIGLKSP